MAENPIATAADYADAMLVCRRAKTWIFVLLLLVLLIQIGVFLSAKFSDAIVPLPAGPAAAAPTTAPATAESGLWLSFVLQYLLSVTSFAGIGLVVMLALVLLLVVKIMLIGRLIGVARVTSAYIWCFVLAVLLFPWQYFFGYNPYPETDFRLPGVLYTWSELVTQVRFESLPLEQQILKWARFLVFPVVALVLLLVIQVQSNRGLRQALGEVETSDDDLLARK